MKRLTEQDLAPGNSPTIERKPIDTLAAVYGLLRSIAAREQPEVDEEQTDDQRAT